MKISILYLSGLSGAVALSKIVLPALSCKDGRCTSLGGLAGEARVDHILKRSASIHVADTAATNAMARRDSNMIDQFQQRKDVKGLSKQQVLPSPPLPSVQPKPAHSTKTRDANTNAQNTKQPQGQASNSKGGKDLKSEWQQQQSPRGSQRTVAGQNASKSTQLGRNSVSESRGVQSKGTQVMSSPRSPISSGGASQMPNTVIAGQSPQGKANTNRPGPPSEKLETSGRVSAGKSNSIRSKARDDRAKSGSVRNQLSKIIPSQQARPRQLIKGGNVLCRRGSEGRACVTFTETNPRRNGRSTSNALQAPSHQRMEADQTVVTKRKFEKQLATQASLDMRKASNAKNSNRLTTGILATGITSSITGTSATMPGLCCHGMACGSAHITCAAVATGSLGAAAICVGCVAGGLTAYKAIKDNKNAKEMDNKLNHAYEGVERTKEGQAKHSQRISEERIGRQELAKEVGDTKHQLAETQKSVGKTLERLTAVDSNASNALGRLDSVRKGMGNVESKAEIALDRTESLGRGVADARKQAMKANDSLNDVREAAEGAKETAMRASSSYGELRRTYSDRFAEQAREIQQLKDAMQKAGTVMEMQPLLHNSPHY